MSERIPNKTRLRHHAGSVWQVIRYVPDEDDYRIRCVVGTVREGFIGGEVEGTVRQVHGDYLRGDGWTTERSGDE